MIEIHKHVPRHHVAALLHKRTEREPKRVPNTEFVVQYYLEKRCGSYTLFFAYECASRRIKSNADCWQNLIIKSLIPVFMNLIELFFRLHRAQSDSN